MQSNESYILNYTAEIYSSRTHLNNFKKKNLIFEEYLIFMIFK